MPKSKRKTAIEKSNPAPQPQLDPLADTIYVVVTNNGVVHLPKPLMVVAKQIDDIPPDLAGKPVHVYQRVRTATLKVNRTLE